MGACDDDFIELHGSVHAPHIGLVPAGNAADHGPYPPSLSTLHAGPQCGWVYYCGTHGLICTSSRKLSGAWLGSQGSAAMYLSRVHVIWILSVPAADSSSSSEYRLSSLRAECRSLTSWA